MFDYVKPEKVGISSGDIKEYIERLEKKGLYTHDCIIAKGNSIVYEAYWKPFDKSFLHRMYSVTKSFVSLAIGFLAQDGLISLDDKIAKYFPEEMKQQKDENFKNQTIRHMLMMSTAKVERSWFEGKPDDRVAFYFSNDKKESRPSGTVFQYDSGGSFVLGALVERLTKQPFLEYLREKCLDEIGFSKEAYCLKCPGGHSWADSALICTPLDLLKTARFVMNGGRWNGKQLLNEAYIKAAVSKQIDNNVLGIDDCQHCGYGYQIWRAYQNSYFFNGMGCQLALCVPDKDLILIYNGDNQKGPEQENERENEIIIGNFLELVANRTEDGALPENKKASEELSALTKALELRTANGEISSALQEKINGITYIADENPMGITKFKISFDESGGKFEYTNAQGDKCLYFGMCENVFGKFPQEGYSDEVGTVFAKGHYYACCASAAWIEESKLFIKVQIIDKYFGNLNITIGFRDGLAGIYMNKSAEYFLDEYEGYASAKASTE